MGRDRASKEPGVVVSTISLISRLLAGGLFLFAAYVKLSDVQAFGLSIRSFDFLPEHLIVLTAYVVPWMELVVGAAILLGVWTRAAVLVYAGLLGSFIALVWVTLERGLQVECGCFGKFKLMCDTGITACNLVQNSVLIGLGLPALVLGGGGWSIDGLFSRLGRSLDRGPEGS